MKLCEQAHSAREGGFQVETSPDTSGAGKGEDLSLPAGSSNLVTGLPAFRNTCSPCVEVRLLACTLPDQDAVSSSDADGFLKKFPCLPNEFRVSGCWQESRQSFPHELASRNVSSTILGSLLDFRLCEITKGFSTTGTCDARDRVYSNRVTNSCKGCTCRLSLLPEQR